MMPSPSAFSEIPKSGASRILAPTLYTNQAKRVVLRFIVLLHLYLFYEFVHNVEVAFFGKVVEF